MESDFVTSDPNEMIELLLGIPDVRVLGLVEDDAGRPRKLTVHHVVTRRFPMVGGSLT
jgi:hypothetical protein